MKNKILLIGAIAFMTIISAPVFSQNSIPATNTSSTVKQTVHVRVKPVSAEKETAGKQLPVAQSAGTAKSTAHPTHLRVQPVSGSKETSAKQPAAPVQSAHPAVATNTFHPRVKPLLDSKSTGTNSSTLAK